MLKNTCSLLLIFLFSSSFVVSSAELEEEEEKKEPTIEETVGYIAKKYEKSFDHTNCDDEASVTVMMVKSCHLKITVLGCQDAPKKDIILPLEKLDPSKVEVVGDDERSNIKLTTTEDDEKAIVHVQPNNTWKTAFVKLPSLRGYDRTRRLSRAFRHLITLCGGQEELF